MNGHTTYKNRRPIQQDADGLIWLFPKLRLNSTKPTRYNESHHNNLCQSSIEIIAKDLYSEEFLKKIKSDASLSYDLLLKCVKNVKRNFKKFRIGRLLKDTLPNYESVTPKKAIRCTLTENQCRTLLLKSLHLVFKSTIANGQEFYKFVCLLIKILFMHVPNQKINSVELSLFKQLLRTKLSITNKVPVNFRQILGKKCALYLTNFCCNILSHCFYVTLANGPSGNSVVFYQRSLWDKIQRFSFKYLTVRQGLKETKLNIEKPCSRLKLMPKTNGIRPIGVAMDENGYQKVRATRLILRYLCSKAFPDTYRTIAPNTFRKNFPIMVKPLADKPIYYCTGDIVDSFNKIDYSIISNFLQKYIGLNNVYYITMTKPDKKSTRIAFGIGRTREEATKNLQNLSINYAFTWDYDYTEITGIEVCKHIRDYAFKPQIYFAGKHYLFNRGVLQGSPLSGILNDIFLLSAGKLIFGQSIQKRLICQRYVDDYIFFSNDKSVVTSAIIKLLDGNIRFRRPNSSKVPISIPRFGCNKVSINFDCPPLARFALRKTNYLPFCGNLIDASNNSILIDYRRYKCQQDKSSQFQRCLLSNKLRSARKLFIESVKYKLQNFLKRFSVCYRTIKKDQRLKEKRKFLSFLFNNILISRATNLGLEIRKRQVKIFLRKQLLLISKKLNSKIKRILGK